jgi:hypothetical protein
MTMVRAGSSREAGKLLKLAACQSSLSRTALGWSGQVGIIGDLGAPKRAVIRAYSDTHATLADFLWG